MQPTALLSKPSLGEVAGANPVLTARLLRRSISLDFEREGRSAATQATGLEANSL